jgi:hypothetical protein
VDGGDVAITLVAITSPTFAPLGSKLAINKKRTMHHAKDNSNNNSKVAVDVIIKSL